MGRTGVGQRDLHRRGQYAQDWNRDFNFKWGYSFNCFTATGHTSALEKPGGPAIKMSRTTVPEGENPQITTENSVSPTSVEI